MTMTAMLCLFDVFITQGRPDGQGLCRRMEAASPKRLQDACQTWKVERRKEAKGRQGQPEGKAGKELCVCLGAVLTQAEGDF